MLAKKKERGAKAAIHHPQKSKIMRVTFDGRIAIQPEVKTLHNGKKVANFSVAVNDGYKNKKGEWVDKTTFIRCAYWKQDSKVIPLLTKGKLIKLEAFIEPEGYKTKKKEIKAALKGTVRWIKLLEGKKTVTTEDQMTDSVNNDDLPF